MMKSVEPNADLPPANSSTMLTYSALPVRRPYHQARESPRNMTGVYLSQDPYGVPSNKIREQRIPPLAKPRGVVYQPRTQPGYQGQQNRQDLMVRSRGEAKAFQPLPIKRAKARVPRHEYHGPSPHILNPKPDYHAVTRKSARSRVPASNDGVTHFEDLRSNSSGNSSDKTTQESDVIENMLDSISLTSKLESEKNLAGLVECYKKICKGNPASVHNLMASGTSPGGKHRKNKVRNGATPLLIRSFRSPQHPHSVVQYSNPRDRTASSPHGASRPPVPAPYFYSSKGLPQTSDEGGNRVKLSRLPGATSRGSDAVLAAPGAGSISRSNSSRTTGSKLANHRPPDGVDGIRPPSLHSNIKIIDSDAVYMIKENFHVPASTPVASTVDINRMSEIDPTELRSTDLSQRHQVVTLPGSNIPGNTASSTTGTTPFPNGTSVGGEFPSSVTGDSVEMESGADTLGGKDSIGEMISLSITISVEDDTGQINTMDLDEEAGMQHTETGSSEVDVSANEVAEKQKESQAKKQAELDQLLEEHHQIISQIEELEKIKEGNGDSPKQEEEDEEEEAAEN
ncbi:uncharacterized protein LOC100890554 [Strongylocentrotus purpuratus]|uniref:Uncharacterized protein n=1 Tax=Strongylocentrotus purpuratus TaxID=7668 RepID=A0A7M7HNP7_STRPU|nr:uncharacterized protein LOC100890554 [Strongylocentrotus purpuratus]XP_011671251.1 uncharacterized protein LOC100890554 [Strongylocentrotus purpuratus]|eukprot:XP_003725735.1 PREDICTED: uncharacterized protein LOC100890554 [Strongylocentrotus purpuratus]